MKKRSSVPQILQEMRDLAQGDPAVAELRQELEDTQRRHAGEVAANDHLKAHLAEAHAKIDQLESRLRAIAALVTQICKL